ncbi:MAG: hypothetical protein IPJ77_03085 [Planctomycetes bacterium]|nr:hypothetical protein [Planctomycetota bacterium]
MNGIPQHPELRSDPVTAPVADRPVRLAWTDPEEGETLWIELWGSPEFVDDLVAQGFRVQTLDEDETASSLCVRIQHRPSSAA